MKKDVWCLEFIDKKGYDHLMKVFEKIPNSELKDTYSIKAMATLNKLIGFFIDKYSDTFSLSLFYIITVYPFSGIITDFS